jgi:hypothetical protein
MLGVTTVGHRTIALPTLLRFRAKLYHSPLAAVYRSRFTTERGQDVLSYLLTIFLSFFCLNAYSCSPSTASRHESVPVFG